MSLHPRNRTRFLINWENSVCVCVYAYSFNQKKDGQTLYCIVSIHLYSTSCSAHQSEALTV